MKALFSLMILLWGCGAMAQAPEGVNYQAIMRQSDGTLLANQTIGLRLSVVDSANAGAVAYVETQTATTNPQGLFSIVIGNGTATTGTFGDIDWASGRKWLSVEADVAGGTSYSLFSYTQFVSVPYAAYANVAGSLAAEKPNYFFSVSNSTSQTISSFTGNVVEFDTDYNDDYGVFNNTTNSFIAREEGVYHFDLTLNLNYTNTVTSNAIIVRMYVGNNIAWQTYWIFDNNFANYGIGQSFGVNIPMNAGDNMQVRLSVANTGSVVSGGLGSNRSILSGFLVK